MLAIISLRRSPELYESSALSDPKDIAMQLIDLFFANASFVIRQNDSPLQAIFNTTDEVRG